MRRIIGALVLTIGLSSTIGGVAWNAAQAATTTKSIQGCVDKTTGSMRFSPKAASTLACKTTERAVTITQTAGTADAKDKGAGGSAVCIDSLGYPRLNLTGTCAAGTIAIRISFDTPSTTTDISRTCINGNGLIRLASTTGRCDRGFEIIPVTTGGELLLSTTLQRPWQLTPTEAQALATPSPTPSSSPAVSTSPSPSLSPSPTPSASSEAPAPDPVDPGTPEPTIAAGPWPRSIVPFAGGNPYSTAYPTPGASPSSGPMFYNTGSRSLVNDPANYANAAPSATPCPLPSGTATDNSSRTWTNCSWSNATLGGIRLSGLDLSGSKWMSHTWWNDVDLSNANLSNISSDGSTNNGFNGNAVGANVSGADLTGFDSRTLGWLGGAWFGLKNAHLAGVPDDVRVVYTDDQSFSLVGRNIISANDMDLRNGALWRPWNLRFDWTYGVINRADMRGLDLRGLTAGYGALRRTDLREADLSCWPNPDGAPRCTYMDDVNMDGTDFSGANLSGAFVKGSMQCAEGAWDWGGYLSEPAESLRTCTRFVGADLSNIRLYGRMAGANFNDATATGATIRVDASSDRTSFLRFVMVGGKLSGTVQQANFSDADLTDSDLSGLTLTGAVLNRTNLSGANLKDTVGVPGSLDNVVLSATTTCRSGSAYNSASMTVTECVVGS